MSAMTDLAKGVPPDLLKDSSNSLEEKGSYRVQIRRQEANEEKNCSSGTSIASLTVLAVNVCSFSVITKSMC